MMEYVHRHSMIHSLHPLIKLIWSVFILCLALILDSPWYLTKRLLFMSAHCSP